MPQTYFPKNLPPSAKPGGGYGNYSPGNGGYSSSGYTWDGYRKKPDPIPKGNYRGFGDEKPRRSISGGIGSRRKVADPVPRYKIGRENLRPRPLPRPAPYTGNRLPPPIPVPKGSIPGIPATISSLGKGKRGVGTRSEIWQPPAGAFNAWDRTDPWNPYNFNRKFSDLPDIRGLPDPANPFGTPQFKPTLPDWFNLEPQTIGEPGERFYIYIRLEVNSSSSLGNSSSYQTDVGGTNAVRLGPLRIYSRVFTTATSQEALTFLNTSDGWSWTIQRYLTYREYSQDRQQWVTNYSFAFPIIFTIISVDTGEEIPFEEAPESPPLFTLPDLIEPGKKPTGLPARRIPYIPDPIPNTPTPTPVEDDNGDATPSGLPERIPDQIPQFDFPAPTPIPEKKPTISPGLSLGNPILGGSLEIPNVNVPQMPPIGDRDPVLEKQRDPIPDFYEPTFPATIPTIQPLINPELQRQVLIDDFPKTRRRTLIRTYLDSFLDNGFPDPIPNLRERLRDRLKERLRERLRDTEIDNPTIPTIDFPIRIPYFPRHPFLDWPTIDFPWLRIPRIPLIPLIPGLPILDIPGLPTLDIPDMPIQNLPDPGFPQKGECNCTPIVITQIKVEKVFETKVKEVVKTVYVEVEKEMPCRFEPPKTVPVNVRSFVACVKSGDTWIPLSAPSIVTTTEGNESAIAGIYERLYQVQAQQCFPSKPGNPLVKVKVPVFVKCKSDGTAEIKEMEIEVEESSKAVYEEQFKQLCSIQSKMCSISKKVDREYLILGGDSWFPDKNKDEIKREELFDKQFREKAHKQFTGEEEEEQKTSSKDLTELIFNAFTSLYRRSGIYDLPAQLPSSLLEYGDDEKPIKVQSQMQYLTWFVKQFDALVGQFPITIEIEDTDLAEAGNQTKKIEIPNIGEAIAELFNLASNSAINSDLAINFLTRIAAETMGAKNAALLAQEYSKANASFLGYQSKEVGREVEYAFNPKNIKDQSSFSEFLQNGKGYIVGIEEDDKSNLMAYLRNLMFAASIIKSVFFRGEKQNKQLLEELKSLFDTKNPASDKEWKEFLRELNSPTGFFNVNMNDPEIPLSEIDNVVLPDLKKDNPT